MWQCGWAGSTLKKSRQETSSCWLATHYLSNTKISEDLDCNGLPELSLLVIQPNTGLAPAVHSPRACFPELQLLLCVLSPSPVPWNVVSSHKLDMRSVPEENENDISSLRNMWSFTETLICFEKTGGCLILPFLIAVQLIISTSQGFITSGSFLISNIFQSICSHSKFANICKLNEFIFFFLPSLS